MAPPRRSGEELPVRNPNVFDDEYAVDVPAHAMDHLPTATASRATPPAAQARPQSPATRTPPTAAQDKEAAERAAAPRTWRSSIAKDGLAFAGGDGGASASAMPGRLHTSIPGHNPAGQRPLLQRPASAASDYAPYDDRSATPVHPHLGSLRSRSRPESRSSTSPHPSLAPARPAHPYGLYPQAGVPVEDDGDAAPPPAQNHAFQRRIGPDGEEQDILGPDGHAEELPPYSRYPEQHEKTGTSSAAAAAPTAPNLRGGRSSPTLSPAESERTSTHHGSTEEIAPRGAEGRRSPSPGVAKQWNEKATTWRKKRRMRVCGGIMPLWLLLAIITTAVLLMVVVASVVGGILASEKAGKKVSPSITAAGPDASFIPSPTGMPPLQTGSFAVPLGLPVEQSKGCLSNLDQWATWSCHTSNDPVMVDLASPPAGHHVMSIRPNLTQFGSNGAAPRVDFSYGSQAPLIGPSQRLYWVTDLSEPDRGPALYFQTTYDKLVVLDKDSFNAGQSGQRKKRDLAEPPPPPPYPPYGPKEGRPPPPPKGHLKGAVDGDPKGPPPPPPPKGAWPESAPPPPPLKPGPPPPPKPPVAPAAETRQPEPPPPALAPSAPKLPGLTAAATAASGQPGPAPPAPQPTQANPQPALVPLTGAPAANPPPTDGLRPRKQRVDTGDQPWFCYWNQTSIEGFVYVRSGSTRGADGKKEKKGKDNGKKGKDEANKKGFQKTQTPAGYMTSYKREILPHDADYALAEEMLDAALREHIKRMAMPDAASAATPTPSPFPYIMKISERRMPNSPRFVAPYCIKMHIKDDGTPVPIHNDDGRDVRINLIEKDPSLQEMRNADRAGGPVGSVLGRREAAAPVQHSALQRRDDGKGCHCLWITPPPPSG